MTLGDFESLFSMESTEADYGVLLTEEGGYLLIHIPQFSEHTITIISLMETITVTTALFLFLSLTLIAGLVFVIPVYHLYFRKGKE